MITFRFYLVTLVAIFLAVALGVTIGSTFLEPALVQDLNNQVESVRDNLDERVARIDELNGSVDDLEAYVEESAPYAVDHRLDGASVLVAATEGTDQGNVERLVARIRQAGGIVPGVVWIQPSFGDPDDAAEVLASLGVDPSDASDEVVAAAWGAVLDAGTPVEVPGSDTTTTTAGETSTTSQAPGSTTETTETTGPTTTEPPTTSTTTPPTSIPPLFEHRVLQILDEAGWLQLQEIEAGELQGEPSGDAPPLFTAVLVSQTGLDDAVDIVPLARLQAARGVPTVVGESWLDRGDEEPARGTVVEPLREDAELSTLVSTVDDIELVQGQVAVVLAIADLGRDIVGHYGYGAGAELVIPAWTGP